MVKKLAIVIFSCFIFFNSCLTFEEAKKVNLSDRSNESLYKEEEIRIAVSSIISPDETFIYYQELFKYLSKKLNKSVKLVQRRSYYETNELIRLNRVEAAFVCSGAYVEGHDEFGMQLLVAPVINGKTTYNSYIIVHRDSDIDSLEKLRAKSFAFTDPLSNTGHLVPLYMLAKMNETPDSFFQRYIYTYSHDKSIEAVAGKIVDGAAVDSLIWDHSNATDPRYTSQTKIINISPPFGIPPVVVPREINRDLKEQMKQVFLHLHEEENGKQILNKIGIDRFIEIEDSAYDSIREIKKWVSSI